MFSEALPGSKNRRSARIRSDPYHPASFVGFGESDEPDPYHAKGIQKIVLELKLQKGSREKAIQSALTQITNYMDRCGTRDGHLILFDQSTNTWEEKIFRGETTFAGLPIQTWGM